MLENSQAWVVLKFGGTSVSSAANWHNIAGVVRARIAASLRPVIVHSALSGITDRLESLLAATATGTHFGVLRQIDAKHRDLARALGIVPSPQFEGFMRELGKWRIGGAAARLSDGIRARVMAMGELLATTLGATFLNAQGIDTAWVDARQVLRADTRPGATHKASLLSATCDFAPDASLQARWRALDQVVITQGFIASNDAGDTVLLGRGGSDTSGSYFAAKLSAARLEIWTDVPGMFSANPRAVPTARLLRALHYDEAQEIASNGAKVLHPRCVLPVRQYKIPLHVYATQAPGLEGTIVSANVADSAAQVKAIAIKKGITLVSMESPGMWHQVGFLADAFQIFKQEGLSVDLVSTSETNVTVSLDPTANTLDSAALDRLTAALEELCRVEILGPCASLSLLGHNIRGILHELGSAFELFQDQKIYLVTQAANDLNFTFVIDESQGDRLVQQLHERLIQGIGSDKVLGPTWQQLFAEQKGAAPPLNWWEQPHKRRRLIEIATRESAAFVYDAAALDEAIAAVQRVTSVKRWAYAMKANWHPEILRRMYAAGLTLECVSPGELEHAFASVPGLAAERVLFTPNFAARSEYEAAFARGVRVTLDNLYPLKMWPQVFRGREIFLRIDPGFGRGHHSHVRTAGVHSKFGVPLADADELVALTGERRGSRHRPARAHRQRHFRRGQLDRDRCAAGRSGGAVPARRGDRSGRRNRRARAARPRRNRFGQAGSRRRRSGQELSALRVLDGAGPVLGGQGRRAGGGRDPAEGQGRRSVCGHRDRHEFPDQARPVRRASRHPQSDAPRRAAEPSGQRGRPDLRDARTSLGRIAGCRTRKKETCFSSRPAAPTVTPWRRTIICVLPRQSL